MSKTIEVSDGLYERLQRSAARRELGSIEQLLEIWQCVEEELIRREELRQLDPAKEGLFAYYGEQALADPFDGGSI